MRDARKIARDVASCVRSSTGDNVVVAVLAQAEAAIIIEAAQAEAKAEGRAEAVEEIAKWLEKDGAMPGADGVLYVGKRHGKHSAAVAALIRAEFGGKS